MKRTKFSNNKLEPVSLDLLPAHPNKVPFFDRVKKLNLSPSLERKIESFESLVSYSYTANLPHILTKEDERELATEVLFHRHRFTEQVVTGPIFKQAALTIVQNIYLFQNRKIFFGSTGTSPEAERQEALTLLTTERSPQSVPLTKTFQHLIIARIWNRILSKEDLLSDSDFQKLHQLVENLNTIRNIYMLLSSKLVGNLAGRINDIYKSSVSYEDAVQIGSFGVARAAYRYHQSSGVRFSTFAANWVFKEIQRQSLSGRLIKISASSLDGYSRAARQNDTSTLAILSERINFATVNLSSDDFHQSTRHIPESTNPSKSFELQELGSLLLNAVNDLLSEKHGDIIKRRYGLPPYSGREQSIISISDVYGVTRSSIYQIEQMALQKLRRRLQPLLS